MARKWDADEEIEKRKELVRFYVLENKSIGEIASSLDLAESTVYDRLIRLGIKPARFRKLRFNNKRSDIIIPSRHTKELAEFVGIMLGDGNLTPTQVVVTLGKKDEFDDYVSGLINSIFRIQPKKFVNKRGHVSIYFGSVTAVKWFKEMGLVFNKVKAQVDVPQWIFKNNIFIRRALRGLFDTDGSVYKLRFGAQISFCNHSKPLINSVRTMLVKLGFSPSKISGYNLYLTKNADLVRFFDEIGFGNNKHVRRFTEFIKRPGYV